MGLVHNVSPFHLRQSHVFEGLVLFVVFVSCFCVWFVLWFFVLVVFCLVPLTTEIF